MPLFIIYDNEMTPFIFTQRYGFFVLCLIVIFCNMPGLNGSFYADDGSYLLENKLITELPLDQVWQLFTLGHHIDFLPIRDLTYYIEYQIFSTNAFGYKVTNLVIYLLSGFAVLLASKSLLILFNHQKILANGYAPLLITALFMLHPSHVESIAWISSRKDLLCSLFTFLALWQFCLGLFKTQQLEPNYMHFIAAWLLFFTALLSKSAVLPLIGIFIILTYLNVQNLANHQKLWLISLINLPFLLLALLMMQLYNTVGIDNGIAVSNEFMQGLSLSDRISTALQILGNLSQISILPIELRVHYNATPSDSIVLLRLVIGSCIILASIWSIWAIIKNNSPYAFAVLFFLLFNTIYLQLLPFSTWSLSSDRFLIISIYGCCLLIALLITLLPKKLVVPFIAMILIASASQTYARSSDWSSTQQLITSNWQTDPSYIFSAWDMLTTVSIPNHQWQQAFEISRNIEPDAFQPLIMHLTRFYYHLNEYSISKDQLQFNMAAQQLILADNVYQKLIPENMQLSDRYIHSIIGSAIKEVYRDLLQYQPNNSQLHLRAAQFFYSWRPQFEQGRIKHYLLIALDNKGLSPSQHNVAIDLLRLQKEELKIK